MPHPPRRRGIVIAVDGISGSGKTTAARHLARALDAVLLAEAFDRLRPRPSLDIASPTALRRLELRLLTEDARRFREADRVASEGSLVVADTGFLGPVTYSTALAALGEAEPALSRAIIGRAQSLVARRRWGMPDRVLWLETTAVERARRVRDDPERHPAAFAPRHERVGLRERAIYRGRLAPVLGKRLSWVDASGPPAEVLRRLGRTLRAGPQARTARGIGRRVLRALEGREVLSGNR